MPNVGPVPGKRRQASRNTTETAFAGLRTDAALGTDVHRTRVVLRAILSGLGDLSSSSARQR
jgi:hypothetical protein